MKITLTIIAALLITITGVTANIHTDIGAAINLPLDQSNGYTNNIAAMEKILVEYPDGNGDPTTLGNIHQYIGTWYRIIGNYKEAHIRYAKALEIFPESSTGQISSTMTSIGVTFHVEGKFEEATNAFYKVISNTNLPSVESAVRIYATILLNNFNNLELARDAFKLRGEILSPTLEYYQVKYGAGEILSDATLDEIFETITSDDKIKPMEFNETIAERVTFECQKNVKGILRSEGKTFIGEIGKTNITEKISVVIDALNAPALEGLEIALISCGVTVQPIDRTFIKTYGKDIADKIMLGVIDPDPVKYLPHVYIALGFDKFQEWMIIYNEGGTFVWPE